MPTKIPFPLILLIALLVALTPICRAANYNTLISATVEPTRIIIIDSNNCIKYILSNTVDCPANNIKVFQENENSEKPQQIELTEIILAQYLILAKYIEWNKQGLVFALLDN